MNYSGVISALVALSNFCLAFVIFKFNRKMGQSKLSVDSSIKADSSILNFDPDNYDPDNIDDEDFNYDYNLDHLSWFESVKGLPKADELTDDRKVSPKSMIITLNNKGELASTNIKITLLFKGYGSEIKSFSNIYYDLKNKQFPVTRRKLFYKEKVVLKIPYMGADTTKDFSIAILRGQFREVDLILKKIEANGHTYFRRKFFNNVVINHYQHPHLVSFKSTNEELVKVLGFKNPDKKLSFPQTPNPVSREAKAWVQSLFAGWQK